MWSKNESKQRVPERPLHVEMKIRNALAAYGSIIKATRNRKRGSLGSEFSKTDLWVSFMYSAGNPNPAGPGSLGPKSVLLKSDSNTCMMKRLKFSNYLSKYLKVFDITDI